MLICISFFIVGDFTITADKKQPPRKVTGIKKVGMIAGGTGEVQDIY